MCVPEGSRNSDILYTFRIVHCTGSNRFLCSRGKGMLTFEVGVVGRIPVSSDEHVRTQISDDKLFVAPVSQHCAEIIVEMARN